MDADIQEREKELEALSKDHRERQAMLSELVDTYIGRFHETGDVTSLNGAIRMLESAILSAAQEDDDRQVGLLSNLGTALLWRYEATGHSEDLKRAISTAEKVASVTPKDHPSRSGRLNNVATFLSYKYNQTENVEDLNFVISKTEEAIEAAPESSSQFLISTKNLATYLFSRFERLGNADDLDRAIKAAEVTLAPTPNDDADRPLRLMNYAAFLRARFRLKRNSLDLDTAIESLEEATGRIPEKSPQKAGILTNQGVMLRTRYEDSGNADDLEEAISKGKEAADTVPDGHITRGSILNDLAASFEARYQRTGNMDDLTEAIFSAEQAIESRHGDDSIEDVEWMNTLATLLSFRHDRTGNFHDLEISISKAQEVVHATPKDHPRRLGRQNNLGCKLFQRYRTTGDTDDLEQAIDAVQQAAKATPALNLVEGAALMNSLGVFLSERYKRSGDMEDLNKAILETREAIRITPKNDKGLPTWLNSLGSHLWDRYLSTGAVGDLTEAISTAEQALFATPDDHPDRAGWLNNLGLFFLDCYRLERDESDLATAVSYAKKAVQSTPEDHPDRAGWSNNLGTAHEYQYKQTGDDVNLDEALKCFLEATHCLSSSPLQRISGARQAIKILHQRENLSLATTIAREAILLLPYVCSRSLSRNDQQYAALQTAGFAADICSVFLQAGRADEALESIEFGRGLILGYLIDGRSDLSELRKDHPSLANDYEKLRWKALKQVDTPNLAIRRQLLEERRQALQDLPSFEKRIRSVDGFERFLLPSSAESLRESAVEGPIVLINITDLGSDAIIVSESCIRAVPLLDAVSEPPVVVATNLTRHGTTREKNLREFECETEEYGSDTFSWLWLTCVKPVIEILTERNASTASHEIPRVWWIGTGAASSLPFHAAGIYADGSSDIGNSQNCLDRIIPSYTPSIKALNHSRRRSSAISCPDLSQLATLVVTMPTTPGLKPLTGVLQEKDAIRDVIQNAKMLNCPTAEKVLEELSSSNVVHFACHGESHPDNPSNSHLFLQKDSASGPIIGRLTVSAILEAIAPGQSWIAYLSACSTTEVKAKFLADENIHLTSAFQVAGFAHVIGSLWSADDDICVHVARRFYTSLVESRDMADSNRAVASALRDAIVEVRRDHWDCPGLWALYTHSGA